MATVFIPGVLRELSGGRDRVEVPGRTLRQVIDALEAECPGMKARLVQDGGVHSGVMISIDDVATSQGLIEEVGPDAEVRILPAISGGFF
jgi:molybdopterin converting factor small subunit